MNTYAPIIIAVILFTIFCALLYIFKVKPIADVIKDFENNDKKGGSNEEEN
jgi:F0F1-type ATP synthase membrane subunit b/b'